MSANKAKSPDYKSLSSASKENGADGRDTLKPLESLKKEKSALPTLKNPHNKAEKKEAANQPLPASEEIVKDKKEIQKTENPAQSIPYAEQQKQKKQQKINEKDKILLSGDHWLARNGHTLTYAGIFLFTLVLYFRPYELIPALSGFNSIALVIAIATVLIYLPMQFSTEGTLTAFSTEIKCILFIALWAVLTIPIAKDPGLAWATFNDNLSKVVLIFIVMVNTLRTKGRLKGLMWLAIGVAVMFSFEAISLFQQGIFKADRIQVNSAGLFGNPNDLALHLAMFIPIALTLGIASKNKFSKLVYFASAAMMIAGNIVTQSRGGFLGLIAVAGVLAWKLGKNQRFKVTVISVVAGLMVLAFAPGNYGMRILSIFNPALDASGSSDQRSELLKQSILVTLRNPQGIGIGNFPIVGVHNLHTHNAYTQVSSEIGLLALVAYVILMVSPIRKLGVIERQMFSAGDFSWMYYLSIGVQASIIGYMVSSFFGPVAYNWYVYYPIAYAVCLRRIYQIGQAKKGIMTEQKSDLSHYFNLQKA
jgi:O-antigen ligase